MITEDYVSFECAKLLKEKEFNERLLTFYLTAEDKKEGYFQIMAFTDDKIDNNYSDCCYLAPTLQMAMKWLRETHDIDFDINTTGSRHVRRYHLAIWENKDEEMVTINPIGYFNKWEQACEAAIKYCLEHLI